MALGGLKLALLSNYHKVTMETDSFVLKAGIDGLMGSMKIALGKFFLSLWKLGIWNLCLM